MVKLLYCGSSSACFELDNTSPFYAPAAYTVLLDGESRLVGENNVFSLFGLAPDRSYALTVRYAGGEEDELTFRTRTETCCVSEMDFGAAGDGVREDTGAIQAAINFLPEGGRLLFPAGTYLSLPLSLRSHITLEFAAGAVLLGSTDRARYPIIRGAAADPAGEGELPLAGFEGLEKDCYQSLLQGSYAEDVTVVGPGRIDGNGQNGDWWQDFESFPAARPRVIFLNRCRDVMLHGVTVANGPSWHVHPFYCENVQVLNCAVTAPKDSPNTDAVNPESCDRVQIIGCRFSVGDDCIAIKAGKIELARKYKTPADRHTIRNCLMEFGHGAVTLGSELAAGIRRLAVTQCYFRATDRGLRIKSRRGRGKDSVIDDVVFDNIRMDRVLTPIVINLWYNCCDPDRYSEYVWSREKLPVDDRTPRMGRFTFRNMECTGAEVAACYIDGLTESPIEEVDLENFSVTFAEDARPAVPAMQNFAQERCRLGLYLDNVRLIRLKNVTVRGAVGGGLAADHFEHIEKDGFTEL